MFSEARNFRDKSESKETNWQIRLFLDRKYIQSFLYVKLVDKSVSNQTKVKVLVISLIRSWHTVDQNNQKCQETSASNVWEM